MKKEIMADDMGDMTLTTEMDYEYESLLQNVGNALSNGRQKVASYIGAQTVRTYWKIGKYIVEYEQNGKEKAEYGSNLLKRISRDLTDRYGSGFGMSNINKMRKMYIEYPILQTLSAKLTWSHYVELLKIEDPLERSFYEKQAEIENWGVRELKRQRATLLFQRLALSTDKDSVMKLAQKGQIIERPEDILKEPFVFEFTGLPQLPTNKESDAEMLGIKLSILVVNCKQYIPSYNWYFRKSDGCIYGTANSPEDICYDETRLTIFESSDDFVLMPECPSMTDEEAAAVVKDWCNKNNIQFIDDMDKIEETYRAIYMC